MDTDTDRSINRGGVRPISSGRLPIRPPSCNARIRRHRCSVTPGICRILHQQVDFECVADRVRQGPSCVLPRCWRPMVESHGNHTNSTSRALKTARVLIGVGAALDGKETVLLAVQVGKPAQLRLEQIVEPQEQVTALELPDRVECLEGQTEAGAIQTDLTLRWNTSVFILASIIGSATGDPRAGCLLPLRAEGADDVGLLEDARRLGMAGTVEAAQGARPRGCGRGRQDPFHLGDPFALPQAGQVDRGALALALPEGHLDGRLHRGPGPLFWGRTRQGSRSRRSRA